MREKVLLLHGWGGSDYPHWQSWLAGELARDYGQVAFPLLDNPHFPTKSRWVKQVKKLLKEFDPDVVICHSLANTLWFHLCNEGKIKKVKRLLLVSPPRNDLDFDTIKSFFPVDPPQDLYAEKAMIVNSDNDPYLNVDEAEKLQKTLGIEMKTLVNAGHINAESDFGEWPWLLEWIKQGNGED